MAYSCCSALLEIVIISHLVNFDIDLCRIWSTKSIKHEEKGFLAADVLGAQRNSTILSRVTTWPLLGHDL